MNRAPFHRAVLHRALPAALVLALALSGCASDSTDDATAADAAADGSSPTTSAAAPAVVAPTPGAGTTDGDTFTYEGVTVTGAEGEEPTITLADDFGPAEELLVADVYEGEGDPVDSPQAVVTVHYVGMGEQSREVFDASWEGGEPVTFGLYQVIPGWTQGLLGMKPGGRRLIIIPGSLGYGEAGNPPEIAPDETLVFVVDLVEEIASP